MSEHLPECDPRIRVNRQGADGTIWCGTCAALTAARDRGYSEAMDDGWGEPGHIRQAVNEALTAARDAVAAKFLSLPFTEYQVGYCAGLREGCEQIDAQRQP